MVDELYAREVQPTILYKYEYDGTCWRSSRDLQLLNNNTNTYSGIKSSSIKSSSVNSTTCQSGLIGTRNIARPVTKTFRGSTAGEQKQGGLDAQ